MLDPDEILCVSGIQPGTICVCGRCDEEIHHSRSWLSSGVRDRRCELAVADRDGVVDREGIEGPLQLGEPAQTFRSDRCPRRDKYAEM